MTHIFDVAPVEVDLIKAGQMNILVAKRDRVYKRGDTVILQCDYPDEPEYFGKPLWEGHYLINHVLPDNTVGITKNTAVFSITEKTS